LWLLTAWDKSAARQAQAPNHFCRAGFGSGSYFLVTLRRRIAFERVNHTSRDPGYFIPYRQKRSFVCLGRTVKTTDLSCELQGGSSHAFSPRPADQN
jgi:hypothetical protein